MVAPSVGPGWPATCQLVPGAVGLGTDISVGVGQGALSLWLGQRMACGPEQTAPTRPTLGRRWAGAGAGRRAPAGASSEMAEVGVGSPGLPSSLARSQLQRCSALLSAYWVRMLRGVGGTPGPP